MVRPVTNRDIGLKVLHKSPAEAIQIDVVAIHGLGAHPDESWCKNVGTTKEPKWRNWLIEDDMLPAIASHARIMRYGYQSEWFGKEATQQNVSIVAERLLNNLKWERKDIPFRPLLFVAHCFGGLVVLKALLEAQQYSSEWPGVFPSTTGLIFLGTPFRGAEGMNQMEMLEAARREYHDDQIQPTALEVLQPGNAYLQDLVDSFLKKMRGQTNKTRIACFFELKISNVGRIVGKHDRRKFVVTQHAGCLDPSESTSKHSLSRTHFDMNKFENAEEEDFKIVAKVIEGMIEESPKLMSARSQYNGKHKVNFRLRGMPIVGTFVQRDAEMRELELLLISNITATNRRRVVVLYGLGGIGKTQLAVEFARKYQHRYSGIFWLDGSSDTSLKQSFADMMQRLPRDELTANGIGMLSHSITDADAAVRECLQWLSLPSNRRWLLIVDNVDRGHNDREDLQAYNVKEYLPCADHGSILITSRLASLQRVGAGVKIGTVAAEQARAILESNAGRVVKDADVVLELLDGLPLALTQAGSYIRETNASASTYAKRYNTTWKELMKKQNRFPLEEYGDRSVLTTWTMSFKQARRQSEEAACLLKLWGFLDSGEMWYEFIAAGLRLDKRMEAPMWLRKIAEDELEFSEAAGLLLRYSLLEAIKDNSSYSIHSVLHRWCGQLAEGEEQYEFCRIAAGLVASNVPSMSEADFWERRKRILTHGIVVSEWIEINAIRYRENSIGDLIQPGLLHDLGYLLANENRSQAEKMYQRALDGYEKAWGPDHTSTLDTVNSMGNLYANLGRLKEAEKMYQRALNGKEKALGPDHTSTLDTVNNMGLLYASLSRLKEADKMYQRALNGKEKALGPDHTSTLDTLNNMGNLYANLGRVKEAEKMYQRALNGKEKALGADHTSTLDTLNNMGILYKGLGKLKEAEKMYQRALNGKEKAWGPDHTSTLDTLNNMGNLYTDLGRLKEAEKMYQRVLDGCEKALGPDHISTLDTVNNIGFLYKVLGRLKEAEKMYQRALDGCEKALGPDHISTLITVNNIGNLYADLGRLKEAEKMYQRALNGFEKAVGLNQIDTYIPCLVTMQGFASLYERQGRKEDAQEWYCKALSNYEKVLGMSHSTCRTLRNKLAALESGKTNF